MSQQFYFPIELTGPAGCVIEAELEIEYSHHRPDPTVGSPGGISIESIEVLVGKQRLGFDGDFQDTAIVSACWEHWQERCERIECERDKLKREHSDAS